MTSTTYEASAPFSEPTSRVTGGWIALFATAWLGIWMAQLTPVQLLLPTQIEQELHAASWMDNVVAFGVISAIAGVCALVAFPVSGALSDRTRSRFGRRRPWMLGGMLLFAAALVLLGVQTTMVGIGVFWSLALIGFCVLTAAITATISDRVPVGQRGYVSGWVSAPQAVGTILGLLLVVVLALSAVTGYVLVAVALVVLVTPFILRTTDEVLPTAPPPLTVRDLLDGLWISPRAFPDFGWTLLSRILVNLGNALGTTLLLYFLMFGLGRGASAEDDLLLLTGVYMVFFIASALIVGRLSDRVGKRKVFVYLAAYLQGLASLTLAFVPDFTVAIVAAGLLGLGYGSFMAVDQALATQVLPDAHSRGKDLGIMNVATAVPQAVAPLLGAGIVVACASLAGGSLDGAAATAAAGFAGAGAGFTGLFVLSALAAALGGLAVIPITSVD